MTTVYKVRRLIFLTARSATLVLHQIQATGQNSTQTFDLQGFPKQDLEELLDFSEDLLRAWRLVSTSRSLHTVTQGTDLTKPLLKNLKLMMPVTEVLKEHRRMVLASITHIRDHLNYAKQW
ncbi:hypothetical protein Y1Q_0019118 [Alligator mississippiensis]|uniref:Uncharacterized protein n=1 Tax=Alligator mississippiensis TaxID=8496 RepID=A0A151MQ23_ALLMI|nr:hypothetical protein Y1Q_0019118 [Alligator mississippiensis]